MSPHFSPATATDPFWSTQTLEQMHVFNLQVLCNRADYQVQA
jgi:uncharacterized cysteine cluster protein YcgN (CxxCxxCC family)